MELEYRFATSDDAALLAELNYDLIRDEGHRNPMKVSELEARMRRFLAHEYRAVIFGRESEPPAAYVLYRDDGDSIYIRHFFVARSQRRAGIGTAAIRLLLDQILPPKCIQLEVLSRNSGGIAFWRALGFTEYALTLELRVYP